MENKTQDVPKKCFCTRCFLPIDENDKVEIDGQHFHRMCGTCCICRTVPTKLKMFYGHVFCEECFKTFVLARFRGESPQVHMDSWWMQFAPGVKAQGKTGEESKPAPEQDKMPESEGSSPDPKTKPCYCARCLQTVSNADKVEICGQTFHCNCARCCSCHKVPKDNIKFYYGQAFCEECFHNYILNRSRDNPAEFFKNCFEQWKNPQFAESMKTFMESASHSHSPMVFMAPGYRADEATESKSATASILEDSSDLSAETRTELSYPGSIEVQTIKSVTAAEKIEKLTKYLRKSHDMEIPKKWKTTRSLTPELGESWVKCPVSSKLNCPECLWQSGTVFLHRE